MNKPASTGNQFAPMSRERNNPPHALGSCACAGKAKVAASKIREQIVLANTRFPSVTRNKNARSRYSAPRISVYNLVLANYFLRDFSPGASVISASLPPFMPTQEFLVSG